MEIAFCNRDDKEYQGMLNELLSEVFFDFRFWYDLNLWDDRYESYSILQDGQIVSNACVYKARLLFKGRQYDALSLGAVATKRAYRGMGYSRAILGHIIEKYGDVPMYLSANDGVVDFYPRFGFERVYEKLPAADCAIDNDVAPRNLRYDDAKVADYIRHRVNFSQALDCLNAANINLFHVYSGYLKDCLYEMPEIRTLAIARQRDTTLELAGVFSLEDIGFADLKEHLPFRNVRSIEFGFMPPWPDLEFDMRACQTDPLFVRSVRCGLGDFKFPELALT